MVSLAMRCGGGRVGMGRKVVEFRASIVRALRHGVPPIRRILEISLEQEVFLYRKEHSP
jgi:hypothetical protein